MNKTLQNLMQLHFISSDQLKSACIGSARLCSARLGSAWFGSARLGSARLGSDLPVFTGHRLFPFHRVGTVTLYKFFSFIFFYFVLDDDWVIKAPSKFKKLDSFHLVLSSKILSCWVHTFKSF
jgi:hypothetical protein